MYSINADDFHSTSVLMRDHSHPILLLLSHAGADLDFLKGGVTVVLPNQHIM